jgi:hypothetical protein
MTMGLIYPAFVLGIPSLLFWGFVRVHHHCAHSPLRVIEIHRGKCKQRCLRCGNVHLAAEPHGVGAGGGSGKRASH